MCSLTASFETCFWTYAAIIYLVVGSFWLNMESEGAIKHPLKLFGHIYCRYMYIKEDFRVGLSPEAEWEIALRLLQDSQAWLHLQRASGPGGWSLDGSRLPLAGREIYILQKKTDVE